MAEDERAAPGKALPARAGRAPATGRRETSVDDRGAGDELDEELARLVQRGDESAREALVRRWLRPVHAVAAAFLTEPSDVEDAVQETFVRVLRGIAGYEPERPFAPWLYQIARNVARSRLADPARRRAVPFPARELIHPAAGPEANAENAELRQLVDVALEALPEQRRLAFRLHDVEGMETAEVARLMGLTPGTVRSHVHHARRALRAALAPKLREADATGDEDDARVPE